MKKDQILQSFLPDPYLKLPWKKKTLVSLGKGRALWFTGFLLATGNDLLREKLQTLDFASGVVSDAKKLLSLMKDETPET